jgi:hypothetical protein
MATADVHTRDYRALNARTIPEGTIQIAVINEKGMTEIIQQAQDMV